MCANTKNLMTKASKKRKGQKIIAKKKISIDETKATHIDKCKSFTKVISHKSEFLLTGCGCTPEEINAHCSNVALKVVCRSKEGSHNGELDKIPLFHVQVWLGELRFNVNEFRATTHMSTQRVPLDRVPPKATRNFWDQCVDNHPHVHDQQTYGAAWLQSDHVVLGLQAKNEELHKKNHVNNLKVQQIGEKQCKVETHEKVIKEL